MRISSPTHNYIKLEIDKNRKTNSIRSTLKQNHPHCKNIKKPSKMSHQNNNVSNNVEKSISKYEESRKYK